MRSDLRWCSDGFEFACWNREIVRVGFVIDAHDREAIAHVAVANCGISGSDVRDMMLDAIERRFSARLLVARLSFELRFFGPIRAVRSSPERSFSVCTLA